MPRVPTPRSDGPRSRPSKPGAAFGALTLPAVRPRGLHLSRWLPLLLMTLSGCARREEDLTLSGVSHALAIERAIQLDSVRYDLAFTIPADLAQPVTGVARIAFRLVNTDRPVILDFVNPAANVRTVRVADQVVAPRTTEEHLVIPAGVLTTGDNTVEIAFTAGNGHPVVRARPGALRVSLLRPAGPQGARPARAHGARGVGGGGERSRGGRGGSRR